MTAPLAPSGQAPRRTRPLSDERPLDLRANADFRALHAEGKLTPEVLSALRALATRPLAEGIERRALLAAALRELADPGLITQGDRHTCAAAVVQAKLAQDDPAEYLRLVAGLASPKGVVTLANGDTLRRHADWRAGSGRSPAGDLLQSAFMQYATGSYDVASDTRSTAGGRGKGLYAGEQSRLMAAVSGEERATVFGNGPQVLDALQEALDAGQTVPAVVKIRDRDTGALQGHSVLIERIEDGQVTFLDPTGKRRCVSLEAFTARLQSVSLPASVTPPSLLAASEGQEGVLAGNPFFDFARAVGQAFEEHVAKPVVQGVQGAVQAVHDHVVQPIASAAGQAGAFVQEQIVRPVQEHLIQPIGQAISPATTWLSSKVLEPLYRHVLMPLAVEVFLPVWEFARANAQRVKEEIERHQETLRTIAAIACAVTPGLNALTLILLVGEAIDAAKEIGAALQTRDWKRGLNGAAKLFGVAAAALGGPILSKVVGSGAAALARVAGGISKLASAGVALAEICDAKADTATRFGGLFRLVSSTVGGTSSLLGEHAEKAAEGFTAVAHKANGYYEASVKTYQALIKGESNWQETVSLGLGLAADLQGDLRNDAAGRRLRHQVREGVHALNEGTRVAGAMTQPAAPQAGTDAESIAAFLTLGGRVAHGVRTDWNPEAERPSKDKPTTDPVAHLAELWRESKGLQEGDPQAQVQAAWNTLKKAGSTQSDEQLTRWLRGWTTDLEAWAAEWGEDGKTWAQEQIQAAWTWWTEQRQAEARP